MYENEKIERVIEAFGEYIDSTPEIDIALTRKGVYLYLLRGAEREEVETGEWLCNKLLGDIEFDVQRELKLDGEPIPKEYRPMLCERLQVYLDKLPEYQHLIEAYK